MPLLVQIAKKKDGRGVLRCVRADGSVTWQTQPARHAPFFALHDLTHLAVESSLGFSHGFFGLIAQGWEIDQTEGKSARGPLPSEALEVENIVGSFDSERASGALLSADELNSFAAIHAESAGRPAPRKLTEDEILRVRNKRGELFSRWAAIEPGGALEVKFEIRE